MSLQQERPDNLRPASMGMMAAGGQRTAGDALAAWAEGLAGRRGETRGRGCLRFAFYGRVSTEDWQDPVTSPSGCASTLPEPPACMTEAWRLKRRPANPRATAVRK
jgi:hypothetical protein